MTFTKYIYSVLLAVTIGLLLLFFVPSLKDEKNDKIVYNYEIFDYEIEFAQRLNLAFLNADKEYILYLLIISEDYGFYQGNTFILSNDFVYYPISSLNINFAIFYEQEIYDYSLSLALYSPDIAPLNIILKVLIMEVV